MHGFFDHLVVIEFQPGQAVDIEPGGLGAHEIVVEHGFGKVGDGIKANGDRLVHEPVLPAVAQTGELEPPRLIEFAYLGTIRITEGFELLKKEVVDTGALADDARGGLAQCLGAEDIAAGKTPAVDEPVTDQQQFELLIVIAEGCAVDGHMGDIV